MNAPGSLEAALYSVDLYTACWPEMLAWYRNVLGARGLVRIPEEGYALLDVGGARLTLLSRPTVGESSRRFNLSFEVGDLQPFIDRLTLAGTPHEAPILNEESMVQIQCWDPDGNSIRLFAWP